jgi:hypothetical protein
MNLDKLLFRLLLMNLRDDKAASRKPSQPLLGDVDAQLRSKPRRRRDPAQPQLSLDPMPAHIDPISD